MNDATLVQLMLVGRAPAILERDPLTRFSLAHGPLTHYPGLTVQQVRDKVIEQLGPLPERVPATPHRTQRAGGPAGGTAPPTGRQPATGRALGLPPTPPATRPHASGSVR